MNLKTDIPELIQALSGLEKETALDEILEKALSEAPPNAEIVPEILMTLYESYRRVGFDSEARVVRERLLREHADSEQARRLREESDGSSNG